MKKLVQWVVYKTMNIVLCYYCSKTMVVVDDQFLSRGLPTLLDGHILSHYYAAAGNGVGCELYSVPLFSTTGSMLSHTGVLQLLDRHVPSRPKSGAPRLLLIFMRPAESELGHFVLCAEKPDLESHYVWWDSLNLSNEVLEKHFGLPATQMFSGASIFERGFHYWQKSCIMAEARWSTCGYWCLVWAHMLNTPHLDEEERDIREELFQPVCREGGGFTERNLKNPHLDQRGASSRKTLNALVHLNTLMLDYYSSI